MMIAHESIRFARRPAGSRRFTLVELLAVIAVILILLAMLIPVLRGAQDAACRTQCMSNIHQLSLATNQFAADNNQRLLPTYMIPAGDTAYRKWMWYLYNGNYLHDEKAYYCGAFSLSQYTAWRNSIGTAYRVMPDFRAGVDDGSWNGLFGIEVSIGYSDWVGGWGDLGKSLTTLAEINRTPIFIDSWFYRVVDPSNGAACYAPLAPRHMRNTQVNVVYADGHAQFTPATDFTNYPYL